jgi:hypothetical protein
LRIGRITIDRHNVFDLGEPAFKRFPYNWANRFHIVTKERFIRRELLFREGDVYNPDLLYETERFLRKRPFFRSVRVVAENPVNGRVDVNIETHDVWTTSFDLSYKFAGGTHLYRIGISESNFLGMGMRAGLYYRQDIDRIAHGFHFDDPHLLGSNWEFRGAFEGDQKKDQWAAGLVEPFRSITTPHSQGGMAEVAEDEGRLFEEGNEIATFQHEWGAARAFYSHALSPTQKVANRLIYAYEYREDIFSNIRVPSAIPPPTDRRTSALVLGIQHREARFVTDRGILTFDRQEDFNRGWDWLIEGGPSLEAFGASQDGAVLKGRVVKMWKPVVRNYINIDVRGDGRYEEGRVQNGILDLRGRYSTVNWLPRHTAFIRANMVWGKNLDSETQFILGGENGLRGYSVRQFGGSNKLLINVENRRTVVTDFLQLMSLGWAVFFDTGYAWYNKENFSLSDLRSDVGIGARVASSRSTNPSIYRLDLAYALDENNQSSRWVVNIGADLALGLGEKRRFEQ